MASESLNSVVIDVLQNNRKAGKSFIEAYRSGGVRLTSQVESGWENVIDKRAGKLNKKLRSKLIDGGQKVTQFLAQRIEMISDGADKTLDKVYKQATTAVEKVATKVESVDNQYATKYFDYVGKVALPGVKLARGLSGKLVDGVETVYDRMAPKRKAVRKVTRKPMVKRARAKSKSATAAA
jgi:hypothetical protein